MSLDDVVTLTITTATVFPTRLGFGIPLIMAYHTVTPNRVEMYTSTKQMLDDGFAITHPAYLMVQRAFSQNPRPVRVVLGKRALAYTKTVRIIPVATTQGIVYTFKVKGPNGLITDVSYTVPGAATVASIVTALQAIIDPIGDVAATDNATHVTITSAAGTLFDLQELPPISVMKILDVTADPGIATDLAAVEAVDAKTWYGVALDSSSEAEGNAAAAFIEARRKLLILDSCDSQITDVAVTTDLASDVKAAAYARTKVVFNSRSLMHYTGLGWMAGMLPFRPGTNTWEYRTVRGATVDTLTDTQETNAKNKNASVYLELGGLFVMLKSVTGAGEWLDVIVYVDKLYAAIQARWLGVVKAMSDIGSKVPYTDKGVDQARSVVGAELNDGVTIGALRPDPEPVVTAPKVADVAQDIRAARRLPDIQFSAELAGAIHSLTINGTLSA